MKYVVLFSLLLFSCEQEKKIEPQIFGCQRMLEIKKISYEGILAFSETDKWELKEKKDGNVIRTQSGKFEISKDGPFGSIVLDKFLIYYDILESPETTEFIKYPMTGIKLKLYFDADDSLSWSLEPGYIFTKYTMSPGAVPNERGR